MTLRAAAAGRTDRLAAGTAAARVRVVRVGVSGVLGSGGRRGVEGGGEIRGPGGEGLRESEGYGAAGRSGARRLSWAGGGLSCSSGRLGGQRLRDAAVLRHPRAFSDPPRDTVVVLVLKEENPAYVSSGQPWRMGLGRDLRG